MKKFMEYVKISNSTIKIHDLSYEVNSYYSNIIFYHFGCFLFNITFSFLAIYSTNYKNVFRIKINTKFNIVILFISNIIYASSGILYTIVYIIGYFNTTTFLMYYSNLIYNFYILALSFNYITPFIVTTQRYLFITQERNIKKITIVLIYIIFMLPLIYTSFNSTYGSNKLVYLGPFTYTIGYSSIKVFTIKVATIYLCFLLCIFLNILLLIKINKIKKKLPGFGVKMIEDQNLSLNILCHSIIYSIISLYGHTVFYLHSNGMNYLLNF